jgi:hypothetical protein
MGNCVNIYNNFLEISCLNVLVGHNESAGHDVLVKACVREQILQSQLNMKMNTYLVPLVVTRIADSHNSNSSDRAE